MEDVKAFIESGILELYVLGDVSPAEKKQVEAMIQKHLVVKAELEEMEKALESYVFANAIQPSDSQRNKILNSLVTNLADDSTFNKKPAPADNVVVMPTGQTDFYKYAFAASIALLIGSLFALSNVYNKLQSSNRQLVALSTQNIRISKTVSYMNEALGVFRDTTYKVLKLKGTKNLPSGGMTVAWSPVKKEVMIDMTALNMPENDKGHQYQLWAIVAGKPVDLGVFDRSSADSVSMKKMKSVSSPTVFAVTLEPRGGSVNPTMDKMMVAGAVNL
ncbi:MAG: Anti-sigma-K factor rskA [Mucilaginibacter sp.]|uniref:anti-sigma factor n=1 Tax=Mucilaginibacter sp. TaxID=1882438 RepID=UPI0026097459|nr:anti-sigma factor [Mucilaginibacter sp.]MDB5005255.1 Anti-sigma-K factor rskA [Mucilaginibacter sp.]